jgi:hypothetical protein
MVFGTYEIILSVVIFILLVVIGLLLRYLLRGSTTGYAVSKEYTIVYEITESPESCGYTDISTLTKKKSKKRK